MILFLIVLWGRGQQVSLVKTLTVSLLVLKKTKLISRLHKIELLQSNTKLKAQVPTTIIVCIVSGWVLVAVDAGVRFG